MKRETEPKLDTIQSSEYVYECDKFTRRNVISGHELAIRHTSLISRIPIFHDYIISRSPSSNRT